MALQNTFHHLDPDTPVSTHTLQTPNGRISSLEYARVGDAARSQASDRRAAPAPDISIDLHFVLCNTLVSSIYPIRTLSQFQRILAKVRGSPEHSRSSSPETVSTMLKNQRNSQRSLTQSSTCPRQTGVIRVSFLNRHSVSSHLDFGTIESSNFFFCRGHPRLTLETRVSTPLLNPHRRIAHCLLGRRAARPSSPRACPQPQYRFYVSISVTRSFPVPDSDDREFQRIAHCVAFQNTLERPRLDAHLHHSQTPTRILNGIVGRWDERRQLGVDQSARATEFSTEFSTERRAIRALCDEQTHSGHAPCLQRRGTLCGAARERLSESAREETREPRARRARKARDSEEK